MRHPELCSGQSRLRPVTPMFLAHHRQLLEVSSTRQEPAMAVLYSQYRSRMAVSCGVSLEVYKMETSVRQPSHRMACMLTTSAIKPTILTQKTEIRSGITVDHVREEEEKH